MNNHLIPADVDWRFKKGVIDKKNEWIKFMFMKIVVKEVERKV